jgi:hypothetical protein
MQSVIERSSELLELMNSSGATDELKARLEVRNRDEQLRLVDKLKAMRIERDAAMPEVDREAIAAREEVIQLEAKLAIARQAANYAQQRAYVTRASFGEGRINAQIERVAPKFLRDAYDDLQDPIDFLAGTVSIRQIRQRIGWRFQYVTVSDADEVSALRQKCVEGQAAIKAMMYDADTPLEVLREQCCSIVNACLAVTSPRLKEDKHYRLRLERLERAKKGAA